MGLERLKLQQDINKLDKMFRLARKHNEDRTQNIKVDCDRLREGSKKLRSMTAQLRDRLERC